MLQPGQLFLHYKNKPNGDSLYKIIGVSVGTKGHIASLNYFGRHSEDLREVVVYKTTGNQFKIYYCKTKITESIKKLASLKLEVIRDTHVIYQNINSLEIWVRPLTIFINKVQLPSGILVNRFEKIHD